MNIKLKIKNWYQGEYIPIDTTGDLVVIGDHRKRHWTSRCLHYVVGFYCREWKWLLPFILALVGTIIAIKKL